MLLNYVNDYISDSLGKLDASKIASENHIMK